MTNKRREIIEENQLEMVWRRTNDAATGHRTTAV